MFSIRRLIFSQSGEQAFGTYTYNLYDKLSRLIETGEVLLVDTDIIQDVAILTHQATISGAYARDRRDLIVTVYDTPTVNLGAITGQHPQEKNMSEFG